MDVDVERREGRAAVSAEKRITIGLMLATLAAKLVLAAHYDGFLTGDDLEVVQSGARYALGLPYTPWSLRCEFHPLALIAPFLELLRLMPSAPDAATIAWAAALPTALASTASIGFLFLLGPHLGLSRRASAAAAAFYALHWLPLGYGSTPYPRPISTMLFLAALLLAADGARFRFGFGFSPLLGGFLIGAAFAVRFSEGVLLAPFLLLLALRTRRSASTLVLGLGLGLGVTGFLIGAVICAGGADLWTWGAPFRSLTEYFRIMVAGAPPSDPRGRPWYWYATSVLQWAGPAAVVLAGASLTRRESRLPASLLAIVVLAFSAIQFKTYRYLQAAVPFVAILMALGWERMAFSRVRWRRWSALALMIVAPAWGIERTISLLRDKSMDAVRAARWIESRRPRAVLLEQSWAYGGNLILGSDIAVRDLVPRRPLALAPADLEGVSAASFYSADLSADDRALLDRTGFRMSAAFAAWRKGVEVFTVSGPTHSALAGPRGDDRDAPP